MTEATTELVVVPPVQGEADVLVDAQALDISGPETMGLAIEVREGVKALIAEIESAFRPHIQRANALHKGLCAELNARNAGPRAALGIIDGKIGDYEMARRRPKSASAGRWSMRRRARRPSGEKPKRRPQRSSARSRPRTSARCRSTPSWRRRRR